MKALIIGATGNIGAQIVKLLVADNQSVTAAGRDLEKVKNHFGLPEIEYQKFDFTDRSTWLGALGDAEKIFLVVPPGSASEDEQRTFFKTAKKEGVQQILFSSGRTTGPIKGSPLNITEGLIKNSGMDWTILRPGWFMQNFVHWIGFTIPTDDAFYLPAGDSKTAFVDVRDIGAVAAEILIRPQGHHGKIYDLTCLEAIDHFAVAKHISNVAGRTITYVPMEEKTFIKKMMEKGRPQKAAEKMAWLYTFVKAGKEAAISQDVKNILKRQPIDFKQFTTDYSNKWQK